MEEELRRATEHAADRRWSQARASCDRCLHRDPNCLAALEIRAQASWNDRDFSDVIAVTQRLSRLNAHEPGYTLLQALAQLASGRFGVASELLRRASLVSRDAETRRVAWQYLELLAAHEAALMEKLAIADPKIAQLLDSEPFFRFEFGAFGQDREWSRQPLDILPPAPSMPWRRN